MNASTVTPTGQATPNPSALIHHLLSTEFPQNQEKNLPDNLDTDTIALRATQITVVLKDILEHPGYRHGGLNE